LLVSNVFDVPPAIRNTVRRIWDNTPGGRRSATRRISEINRKINRGQGNIRSFGRDREISGFRFFFEPFSSTIEFSYATLFPYRPIVRTSFARANFTTKRKYTATGGLSFSLFRIFSRRVRYDHANNLNEES